MNYTVYLSSTLKDLGPERDVVKEALLSECVIKESYTAHEGSLVQSCLENVEASDVYVGILGLRYGYVPEDAFNPGRVSITVLEYERAVAKNIPRLIFIKSDKGIVAPMMDAHTGEHPKDLIEQFRKRAEGGTNQRAAEFSDAADLKPKVIQAFNEFKTRREKKAGPLLSTIDKHPSELVTDVAVITVRGTDDSLKTAIQSQSDTRFKADDLSPDDARYLFELDRRIRNARTACLLMSQASLGRFKAKAGLVAAALKAITLRAGNAFLLLDGPKQTDLPPDWIGLSTIIETNGELESKPKDVLAQMYRAVREHSNAIADDRRIGIPCLVIALTQQEATALAQNPEAVMASLSANARAARKIQFEDLKSAVTKSGRVWPQDFYGATAEAWRPFGTGPGGGELLEQVIARVNAAQRPGSRERRLLQERRLQPQHYSFDDYRTDRFGSRAMMEDMRDRGCVVLVDELALLYPDIRQHADTFLSGERVAVVSANPCDPAHYSTAALLDEFSYLRVGSLFERFRDQQDPRCELALNSQARLERWLRLVLPEFVSILGNEESNPNLVNKAQAMLAS